MKLTRSALTAAVAFVAAAAVTLPAAPWAGAAAPSASVHVGFEIVDAGHVDRRGEEAEPDRQQVIALLAAVAVDVDVADQDAYARAWQRLVADLPEPDLKVAAPGLPEPALAPVTTVEQAASIATAVRVAVEVGLTGDALLTAVAVAGAESGYRPSANNAGLNADGSVDYGLWQINSIHGPPLPDIYDPAVNAQWMWRLSSGGTNWTPWVAYNTGSYRRFLPAAAEAIALVLGQPA